MLKTIPWHWLYYFCSGLAFVIGLCLFFSSRLGIVNGLSFVDLQGLDPSYLSTWVRKVQAVTPKDVQTIAQTYFLPEKITIVIVGDKSKIQDSLKGLGPIVE